MNNQSDRSLSIIILFAATLFVSASIMFVLQPMFGKILLPLLGGSPAVWNTCLVFYQTILFLGYLYAHFISTRQNNHRQILIHTAIILISFIALPLALPENTVPPTDSDPTFWLVGILSLSIGLPFFVVSTTSPLLQKWFANIGHHTSHDPYYLYAASNVGSLLALLSYPFLLEPNIGLDSQKTYWAISYVVLCILILGCAWLLWKVHAAQKEATSNVDENIEPLTNNTRLYWLALAFVPSSLLLGLTNFISTDIASVPLLWIIPLTLYLLSFVIVFSRLGRKVHDWMVKLQPMVLLPFIAYSFINPAILPYWVDLTLHLTAFFLAIMVCHGELAKHRPHTQYLTDFYLIMSFAGMLGGMFNTFVAPFIFNAVYEYPIMIISALLLRPRLIKSQHPWQQQLLLDSVFPIIVLISGLTLYASVDQLPQYLDPIGAALILLTGLIYSFREKPSSLAMFTAILIFFTIGLHGLLSNTLFQERTFFGVISVRESTLLNEKGQPEKFHEFYHGTTKHGAQRLPAHLRTTPLTYFSRQGPIGQFFSEYDNQNDNWNIAVVGLGAGTLSCYAKKSQPWKFYELDPDIVDVAQ
ncbi:MAG: spermidine synthase, partial [Methyloprofundus sp.]|nr:spermidine synthase [Methyloprofundus sp.]